MNTVPRILIVGEEPASAELITVGLRDNGFQSVWAEDREAAQRELDDTLPDVILLDWMLQGQNGVTLARTWRREARTKATSIIMLTAREDEPDKVAGLLDAGADDFITKPFSTLEMVARIRAVLRRREPAELNEVTVIGDLSLDVTTYRARWKGKPVKLGPTEFKLLHYLMTYAERVHSRSDILDKVWGNHVLVEERTVDVHIKRLRESLGEAGVMVETIRGTGYRLAVP